MTYNAVFPISSNSPIMYTLFSEIEILYLGNKHYSRKLFWVADAVNVNVDEVKGTVSSLVKTRDFINALI